MFSFFSDIWEGGPIISKSSSQPGTTKFIASNVFATFAPKSCSRKLLPPGRFVCLSAFTIAIMTWYVWTGAVMRNQRKQRKERNKGFPSHSPKNDFDEDKIMFGVAGEQSQFLPKKKG